MGVKTERLQTGGAVGAVAMARAAALLRGGGSVAFPTETVYGLGANALDAAAVAKIFAAKQRPGWDPLIVHVWGREMLEQVVAMPPELRDRAQALMQAFWPGPLTLLLPRTADGAGCGDCGPAAGWGADPGASGGAGVDSGCGSAVGRAQCEPLWRSKSRRRRRMCWRISMAGSMLCWTVDRPT